MMKKKIIVPLLLCAAGVQAADVGFDLNINIGNRPRVVAPAPVPVIVVEEPPEFIYPSSLGFYVAVGVPYDMFYISSSYYLFRGNVWYRAGSYNGPWVVVRHEGLPRGLRKHRYEEIRSIRDHEYRVYASKRDSYHGKRFKPEREYRERQHHEKDRDHGKDHSRGEGKGHGKSGKHD